MAEREQSKFELYREFDRNRYISRVKSVIPIASATVISGTWAGLEALGVPGVKDFDQQIPREVGLAGIALVTLSMIPVYIQFLDFRTRINSKNGRIAVQIAQMEGENPQTSEEQRKEIRRVDATLRLARGIFPTREALLAVDLNYKVAKFRSRKNPDSLGNQWMTDRRYQKWLVKNLAKPEVDPKIAQDALILADSRWAKVFDNEKQPIHRRRYAHFMREEIRGKLQELLSSQ